MPFARSEMSLISGSIDWYNVVVVVAILLDDVSCGEEERALLLRSISHPKSQ